MLGSFRQLIPAQNARKSKNPPLYKKEQLGTNREGERAVSMLPMMLPWE